MKSHHLSEEEKLLLKHLDASLSPSEQQALERSLTNNEELTEGLTAYQNLRAQLKRQQEATFGPFFAERIVTQLKKRTQEIDYLILFFFKKYQVLAVGVLVALLTANVFLADQFTIASIFGLEKESIEDIVTIDVYQNLNE